MAIDMGLVAWVEEVMAPVGTVTWRRMMGGATFYCDGVVFAIITGDGVLRFKADAESDAIWDAEGCERFSVEMAGKTATMNYRTAPDAVLDDEFPLSMFFEALEKKMRPVIASTTGITGRTPA